MTRIPFIKAQFFGPGETRSVLETRFETHLRRLRGRHLGLPPKNAEDGCDALPDRFWRLKLSDNDRDRIQRRARRIFECRKAANGLEHLKRDDRERLEVLKDGVRLIRISSEHRADEIAAALHGEMPWMAQATEIIWHGMRRSVREGWPGLRLPPLALDGPPGIGKSHFARILGKLLSTPTTVIEATGESASFGIVGSQRGWGGSCPGRLIETVLQSRIANPVMEVDEVEKAGAPTSIRGHSFGLAEALLPLLEPLTAKDWS